MFNFKWLSMTIFKWKIDFKHLREGSRGKKPLTNPAGGWGRSHAPWWWQEVPGYQMRSVRLQARQERERWILATQPCICSSAIEDDLLNKQPTWPITSRQWVTNHQWKRDHKSNQWHPNIVRLRSLLTQIHYQMATLTVAMTLGSPVIKFLRTQWPLTLNMALQLLLWRLLD